MSAPVQKSPPHSLDLVFVIELRPLPVGNADHRVGHDRMEAVATKTANLLYFSIDYFVINASLPR